MNSLSAALEKLPQSAAHKKPEAAGYTFVSSPHLVFLNAIIKLLVIPCQAAKRYNKYEKLLLLQEKIRAVACDKYKKEEMRYVFR